MKGYLFPQIPRCSIWATYCNDIDTDVTHEKAIVHEKHERHEKRSDYADFIRFHFSKNAKAQSLFRAFRVFRGQKCSCS